MTIIDCCISLKMIKKILVVLGVVDMRQLLLKGFPCFGYNNFLAIVNWVLSPIFLLVRDFYYSDFG